VKKTLTLVTCYPFYFVGHAPKRFVVAQFKLRAGDRLGTTGKSQGVSNCEQTSRGPAC
jgi:sortase (surface protein transpeptidase)